jgi:hypothetical protein
LLCLHKFCGCKGHGSEITVFPGDALIKAKVIFISPGFFTRSDEHKRILVVHDLPGLHGTAGQNFRFAIDGYKRRASLLSRLLYNTQLRKRDLLSRNLLSSGDSSQAQWKENGSLFPTPQSHRSRPQDGYD